MKLFVISFVMLAFCGLVHAAESLKKDTYEFPGGVCISILHSGNEQVILSAVKKLVSITEE